MGYLHYSPSLGAMARCTAPEKCPFAHWDTDAMKKMAPVSLASTPELMKNSFLGTPLLPQSVAPALNQLRSAMAPELFNLITRMKAERDGADKYHMTVIRPPEYRKLSVEGKKPKSPKEPLLFELLGVGTASNSKSQAWFGVIRSPMIDDWRRTLGLPQHDLHVTLGFTAVDIHNVPKGLSTLV